MRVTRRLLIAALTFMCSIMAHRVITLPASPSSPLCGDEISSEFAALRMQTRSRLEGTSRPPITRISQSADVSFHGIGFVRVSAHEDIGSNPMLVFTRIRSGEELLRVYVGGPYWLSDYDDPGMNPKLRFRLQHIQGFQSPLVIGLAINPGGSDDAWESFAVGEVNGRLQDLAFEHLQTEDEGGFFFGDLGNGLGFGAAQWDFIWGEDEAHPPPHKYEFKLFRWNGRRFEWAKVLRSRAQYNSDRAALRSFGFHYTDLRASFPDETFIADR